MGVFGFQSIAPSAGHIGRLTGAAFVALTGVRGAVSLAAALPSLTPPGGEAFPIAT